MANTNKKSKPVTKQAKRLPLHQTVATGGSAKGYKGSKSGFK